MLFLLLLIVRQQQITGALLDGSPGGTQRCRKSVYIFSAICFSDTFTVVLEHRMTVHEPGLFAYLLPSLHLVPRAVPQWSHLPQELTLLTDQEQNLQPVGISATTTNHLYHVFPRHSDLCWLVKEPNCSSQIHPKFKCYLKLGKVYLVQTPMGFSDT